MFWRDWKIRMPAYGPVAGGGELERAVAAQGDAAEVAAGARDSCCRRCRSSRPSPLTLALPLTVKPPPSMT